ncbi:MAG: sialate O-acetylesterase [Thermoguttaceae bacterium]
MPSRLLRLGIGSLALAFAVSGVWAAVKLPAIFSDNMILQQDQSLPVWGWAEPGEQITVAVAGQTATAKAGQDGRWRLALGKMHAGGPHELVVKGSTGSSLTIRNVLVGEVWLCSGQSNMEWPVAASLNAQQEMAAATYPQIRLFQVQKKTAEQPQADCVGSWLECSPETVPGFSGVGYFFIRRIHQELKVPAGMIQSSWGATPAEAWTSRKALESEPSLKPLLDLDRAGAGGPASERPARLFNGMIAPLAPLAIRGVIWYQGESNVDRAWQYRTLFPLMIRDWRAAWGRDELPFGFVQIAPFDYVYQLIFVPKHYRHLAGFLRPPRSDLRLLAPELRDAQLHTLKVVPQTGMAVTMDIGDPDDIHPPNKQEVGRRLALWALAKVYGKDLVYCGPMYKSMAVEGNKIRIAFEHVGSGLATRDGLPPSHFTIAGEDQRFVPAKAAIEGQTVVVYSGEVARPVAVRYAWRDDAEPNLMNREGLPASPFRTDDWRLLTEGKH